MRAMSGWAIGVWAVAFALLILDVVVSTYNVQTLTANDRAVGRSREISRALADLVAATADAETGQRGYHLTGEEDYLDPFRAAEKTAPERVDTLRDLTAGDPFYDDRLIRLAALVDQKFAELRGTLSVRMAAGPVAGPAVALAAIRAGHGKRTMDALRAQVVEMQEHEDEALRRRSVIAAAKYQSSEATALFGGIITLLMVAMAFAIVRRELVRRERAEAGARRAAAELAGSQRETAESLALLDAFLENAPIGIAFFDSDLRYRLVNETLAAGNGRAVSEHVGRPLLEAIPDMPAAIVADVSEVARTGRPLLNREAVGRPGSRDRTWLSSYFPVRTKDGRALGVGVVAQDVTERLAAVRRVRESEARKSAILQTALDCVISIDHDGRVVDFNPAAERTFGHAAAEAIGRDMAELIVPPAYRDGHRSGLARYVATGQGQILNRRLEMPGRRKDGSEFPAELSITAIHLDGRPVFTAYLRDITDRKRAEDAIRQSLDRFRTLVEAVPQMVFVAGPDGALVSANGRWIEYTGRTPREAPDWIAAVHPEDADAARAAWRDAVQTVPDRFTHEGRVRSHDGGYRWMLVTAVALREAARAAAQWVATLTDIDDQKRQREVLAALVKMRTSELESTNHLLREEIAERTRAEARAQAAAIELGRSNEELEKFAYVASHDLQEPLRKIQAFGDRLVKKFRDALGPGGQEYVDRMQASARRMRTLIDDLLSFSRVSTKVQPFAPVDLGEIVRDVLSDLDARLAQTGGRVDVGELPTVAADPLQMRQLFQNLIANALKFARPGVAPLVAVGAVPWAAVPTDADPPPPPGEGYRVTVADNGIGFDQGYVDRVFEVFQRLHGRGEYEGTGIGLAIVRKIVQRHGGEITARSREGHGATFIIDLPAAAG
jgi:PAS domain S-box-containing protein